MGDTSRLHAIINQGGIMARVLNPLNSADAKGSVGGMTYTKSPAGNVCKRKSKPVQRSEPYKQSNRARMGFLSRHWGALTGVQRTSWKNWAIDHPQPDGFGGTFIMSGINAYCKLNFNAMRLGLPADDQDLPPVDECPASLNSLVAETGAGVAGDVDLTWTHNGAPTVEDWNEVQVAGPFISPGRKEVYSRFSYVLKPAGNLLVQTLGGLDEGMWYWFRVRYVDEFGQTSAWLYSQATPKLTI
ncbi:hypothetical protein ES703_54088 [subsurface metagenome]